MEGIIYIPRCYNPMTGRGDKHRHYVYRHLHVPTFS